MKTAKQIWKSYNDWDERIMNRLEHLTAGVIKAKGVNQFAKKYLLFALIFLFFTLAFLFCVGFPLALLPSFR